jgi:hypothetical protein
LTLGYTDVPAIHRVGTILGARPRQGQGLEQRSSGRAPLIGSHDPGGEEYIVQRPSFRRAVTTVVVAALCVLLLQVDAGADESEQAGKPVKTTKTTVVQTTLAVETTLADPTTTEPSPTTEPPTTVPPTTEPPTTAPPTTEPPTTVPPTTAPPTTEPPTTASEPVIGPNTLPPVTSPPAGGSPSTPGTPVAIGSKPATGGSGPTAALSSAVRTLGSTATTLGSTVTTAAHRIVMPTVRKLARIPAVRKLAQSEPVAATKRAVMFVTEELSELKPSRVAPYLWLALLALLVSCGAFLRLWWAPVDWPSTRSLSVGAHRRAGQQPRRAAWLGWPATPPPRRSRRRSGWQPALPAEPAAPSRSRRIGIDVARLRSLPPAGKPIFTGDDDLDPD